MPRNVLYWCCSTAISGGAVPYYKAEAPSSHSTTPYTTAASVPYTMTGPAMRNILAPVPGTRPSALNSMAALTTALAKAGAGSLVPAQRGQHRREQDQGAAGQGARRFGVRALLQKQLPQPFAQQADAAAYAERPKAVCQKRRVRPGLLHPACAFLRCHLHLPAPPFADSLPGAAGTYPIL